jgi:hypothetical protein
MIEGWDGDWQFGIEGGPSKSSCPICILGPFVYFH